ncbi:MAG: malectin domain-containing carbohydrate-binding protein [Kiritimatiellae bacterium]|nr:malectin domain-containing carbohydrate-binding protein [Kiritimatiellia bacterium]
MKSIIRIAQTLTALVLAITAAPVGALTATTTSGNGQIALSWTVEAGATAYRVEHATTSGGPYAELASGLTVTTYTHTGVASGSTNYYVVTASTPGGDVASAEVMGRWVASRIRAINCGGPAVGDFVADTAYLVGTVLGTAVATSASIDTSAAANPAAEAIYQTARTGAITYEIGTFAKNRSYTVRAHYAEIVNPLITTRGQFYHVWLNDASVANIAWRNWFDLKNFVNAVNKVFIDEKAITPSTSGRIKYTMGAAGIVNALEVIAYDAPIADVRAYPRDGKVKLDFSAVIDALHFTVKRATTSGGPYATIATDVAGSAYEDIGLSNGTTYYYVVTAFNNWGAVDSAELATTPGVMAYAINISGPVVGRFTTENNLYTLTGGTAGNLNPALYPGIAIPFGTRDPGDSIELHRTYRYGAQTYTFSGLVAGASYLVRLHDVEYNKTAVGQRVFHVDVNGTRMIANLDIFSEVLDRYKAHVREFLAMADENGVLAIQFVAVTDQPVISGIEIRQQSGTMTPINPGSVTATAQPYLITLTWTRASEENSYTIWRSETAGGPYAAIASNVVSAAYMDATPADGVKYYYRVVGESEGAAVSAAASAEASATSTYGTTQTGLHAQYYKSFSPDGVGASLAFSEIVPTVDENWGAGPIGSAAVGDRDAKVVWNGNVMLSANSTYTFHAKANGGFRLWVAYQCVIDRWNDPLTGEYVSNILKAPSTTGLQPIHVEYYNTEGNAEAVVEWACPDIGIPRGVVPANYLRPVAMGDPGAWVFRDIDTVSLPGYGYVDGEVPGRFWVYAAGLEGIQRHQFACQPVEGAFELTARVASYSNRSRYGGTWKERMGLVVRSSLAGNEGFSYGIVHDNDNANNTRVMYKPDLSVAGGFTETAFVYSRNIPMYLKLRRERKAEGYETTASYSADGVNWTQEHVSMVGSSESHVYAGLSLGVEDTELLHGYFDNVSLKPLHLTTLVVIR